MPANLLRRMGESLGPHPRGRVAVRCPPLLPPRLLSHRHYRLHHRNATNKRRSQKAGEMNDRKKDGMNCLNDLTLQNNEQ